MATSSGLLLLLIATLLAAVPLGWSEPQIDLMAMESADPGVPAVILPPPDQRAGASRMSKNILKRGPLPHGLRPGLRGPLLPGALNPRFRPGSAAKLGGQFSQNKARRKFKLHNDNIMQESNIPEAQSRIYRVPAPSQKSAKAPQTPKHSRLPFFSSNPKKKIEESKNPFLALVSSAANNAKKPMETLEELFKPKCKGGPNACKTASPQEKASKPPSQPKKHLPKRPSTNVPKVQPPPMIKSTEDMFKQPHGAAVPGPPPPGISVRKDNEAPKRLVVSKKPAAKESGSGVFKLPSGGVSGLLSSLAGRRRPGNPQRPKGKKKLPSSAYGPPKGYSVKKKPSYAPQKPKGKQPTKPLSGYGAPKAKPLVSYTGPTQAQKPLPGYGAPKAPLLTPSEADPFFTGSQQKQPAPETPEEKTAGIPSSYYHQSTFGKFPFQEDTPSDVVGESIGFVPTGTRNNFAESISDNVAIDDTHLKEIEEAGGDSEPLPFLFGGLGIDRDISVAGDGSNEASLEPVKDQETTTPPSKLPEEFLEEFTEAKLLPGMNFPMPPAPPVPVIPVRSVPPAGDYSPFKPQVKKPESNAWVHHKPAAPAVPFPSSIHEAPKSAEIEDIVVPKPFPAPYARDPTPASSPQPKASPESTPGNFGLEEGPNFQFPDFELMDLGDIEKFFNENFFKKIPLSSKEAQLSQEERNAFMHGVPESAYEPTIMNDNNKEYETFLMSELRGNPFKSAERIPLNARVELASSAPVPAPAAAPMEDIRKTFHGGAQKFFQAGEAASKQQQQQPGQSFFQRRRIALRKKPRQRRSRLNKSRRKRSAWANFGFPPSSPNPAVGVGNSGRNQQTRSRTRQRQPLAQSQPSPFPPRFTHPTPPQRPHTFPTQWEPPAAFKDYFDTFEFGRINSKRRNNPAKSRQSVSAAPTASPTRSSAPATHLASQTDRTRTRQSQYASNRGSFSEPTPSQFRGRVPLRSQAPRLASGAVPRTSTVPTTTTTTTATELPFLDAYDYVYGDYDYFSRQPETQTLKSTSTTLQGTPKVTTDSPATQADVKKSSSTPGRGGTVPLTEETKAPTGWTPGYSGFSRSSQMTPKPPLVTSTVGIQKEAGIYTARQSQKGSLGKKKASSDRMYSRQKPLRPALVTPASTVPKTEKPRTPPPARATPRMDYGDYEYYYDDEDYYYNEGDVQGRRIVHSRPHPTNPEYEYVYYYDYDEYPVTPTSKPARPQKPAKPVKPVQPIKAASLGPVRNPVRPSSPASVQPPSLLAPGSVVPMKRPQRPGPPSTKSSKVNSWSQGPPVSYRPPISSTAFLPTGTTFGELASTYTTAKMSSTASTTVTTTTSTTTTTTTTETTTTTATTTTTTTTTTTATTTTTQATSTLGFSSTKGFPFRRPQDVYTMPEESPCQDRLFCDVSDKNYPLDRVIQIVVLEGPAVQNIYQDVIREFPSLIGTTAVWESKRRRSGSCETLEETLRPGWAKTIHGKWVAVVNTNEYPQEVKTVDCSFPGSDCSMMYSRTNSKCEQKKVRRKLMVVDPSAPEKGVFAAPFDIPTECSCSVVKYDEILISTAPESLLVTTETEGHKGIRWPNGERRSGIVPPQPWNPQHLNSGGALPPLHTRDPLSTSKTRFKNREIYRGVHNRKKSRTKPTVREDSGPISLKKPLSDDMTVMPSDKRARKDSTPSSVLPDDFYSPRPTMEIKRHTPRHKGASANSPARVRIRQPHTPMVSPTFAAEPEEVTASEDFPETTIHYATRGQPDLQKEIEHHIKETFQPELGITSLFDLDAPSHSRSPPPPPTPATTSSTPNRQGHHPRGRVRLPGHYESTQAPPSTTMSATTSTTTSASTASANGAVSSRQRVRIMLPTMATTTYDVVKDDLGIDENEEIPIDEKDEKRRVRVPPTKSTTPPPISEERRNAIEMMRDKFRSKFKASKKATTMTTTSTTASTTTTSTTAVTARPRSFNSNRFNTRPTTTTTPSKEEFMVLAPSKISEANFDDFKTIEEMEQDYAMGRQWHESNEESFEDHAVSPKKPVPTTSNPNDEHVKLPIRSWKTKSVQFNQTTGQVILPTAPTKGAAVKTPPIRDWKVNPVKIHIPEAAKPTLPTPPPTPEIMRKISENFHPTPASSSPVFSSAQLARAYLKTGIHSSDPAKVKETLGKIHSGQFTTLEQILSSQGGQSVQAESEPPAAVKMSPKELTKAYLKSGIHASDPMKMKAILVKIQTGQITSLEELQGKKKPAAESAKPAPSKPKPKWVPSSKKEAREPEVDREEAGEAPRPAPEPSKPVIRPWHGGIGESYYGGGGKRGSSSSSSYYSQFARNNVGRPGFRPPKPDDENAEIAKSIFEKYASGAKQKAGAKKSSTAAPAVEAPSPAPSTATPKRYPFKKGDKWTPANANKRTPVKPKKQQAEFPSAEHNEKSAMGGMRPTPGPFRPWHVRNGYKTTAQDKPMKIITTATTPEVTTPRARSTTPPPPRPESTTTTLGLPIPSQLDTSSFVLDSDDSTDYFDPSSADYNSAYFDFERIPDASHTAKSPMSIDTTSFVYTEGSSSSSSSPSADSAPGPRQGYDSHALSPDPTESEEDSRVGLTAKLPIRNVLDIFQELKLSFGRARAIE